MPWIAGLIIAGVVLFAVKAAAQHAASEPRLPVPKFRVDADVIVQPGPIGGPQTGVFTLATPGVIKSVGFDDVSGIARYDVTLASGMPLFAIPESQLSPAPTAKS